MKRLIGICLLIATAAAAQQRPVSSDGTNLFRTAGGSTNIISPLVVSNLTVNGSFRLQYAGLAWDDIVFTANESGKSGSDDIEPDHVDNGLGFETGCTTNITDDHFWSVAELLHNFKTNSSYVAAHVHFRQTNADQTNLWWLHYRWIEVGRTNYAWTQVGPAINQYSFTSGQMHQIAEFPHIANPGISTISSIIDIKIHRDGNFGTGTILLKEFGIHYQRDSVGSNEELTKTP